MNKSIRRLIKDTRCYQIRKIKHSYPNRDLKNSKYILYRGFNLKNKIEQYRTLFSRITFENLLANNYIYFIDEHLLISNKEVVVDNSPINYQMIIDYSLCDLKKMNSVPGNYVGECNIKFIDCVEQFIDEICREIEKRNLKNKEWYIQCFTNMKYEPASDLKEALQRILFWNQLLWQSGHYLNGLGRLDRLLDKFEITDETDKLLEDFFLALHKYYNYKSHSLKGDIGQIAVIGGKRESGEYWCNAYSFRIISILNKLHIPDPKILLRVSKEMPDDLFEIAFDSIASGIGSPLLSNDDVVIPSLLEFGYEIHDAYNYGVSACWEPLSIGNSLEQNNLTNIEFGKVFCNMIMDPEFIESRSMEDVMRLYLDKLSSHVDNIKAFLNSIEIEEDPIYTLFNPSCLEKNKTVAEGGAKYNNYGLLSVGMASAVNSLCNIDDYVFGNNQYSLMDIKNMLDRNYEGYEKQRILFEKNIHAFGRDNKKAEKITNIIMDEIERQFMDYRNKFGGKVKFGLSSPGYVDYGKTTSATADGRKSDSPFSTHISANGTALTEILNFASKLDYKGIKSNGNVVDIVVHRELVKNNRKKFIQLIKKALGLGIFQCQFNVVSYSQLLDAKIHPENYKNLIVRVWGFSAYFNDLPEDYKDVIIERARLAT